MISTSNSQMASLPALISNLISVTIENRHTVTNCNGSIQFFSGNDYKMESPIKRLVQFRRNKINWDQVSSFNFAPILPTDYYS